MSTPILSWSKHFYATLDNIVIPKGRRPLDQSKVDAIARSIKDSGLLNPPTVRENPNTKEINSKGWLYILVAGGHRVAAMKQLKMRTCPVHVLAGDLSPDMLALIEIYENLMRSELTTLEVGILTTKRAELCERMGKGALTAENSSAKAPRAHRATGKNKGGSTPSATSDRTAAKSLGVTNKTVATAKKLVAGIGMAVAESIVGTSLDKPRELKALAAMPERERVALAERAKAGEKVSAPKGEGVAVKSDRFTIEVVREHGQWKASCQGVTCYGSDEIEACTELFEQLRRVAA